MSENNTSEFIYVRTNKFYEVLKLCKLGKTKDLIGRDNSYSTGEPIKGNYILVLKVNDSTKVESLLKKHFKSDNFNSNGGKEFFNEGIIKKIIPFLESQKIKYEKINNPHQINKKIIDNLTNKIKISVDKKSVDKKSIDEKSIDEKLKTYPVGQTLICYICNRSFTSKHRFQKHVDSDKCCNKPLKIDNEYYCFYCERKYKHCSTCSTHMKKCEKGTPENIAERKKYFNEINTSRHMNNNENLHDKLEKLVEIKMMDFMEKLKSSLKH